MRHRDGSGSTIGAVFRLECARILPHSSIPHQRARGASEIYRAWEGGRLEVMFQLNDTVRRLAIAGIRGRHPDYTDAEVRCAYARMMLGDRVVRAVWPDRRLVDP